MHDPQRHRHNAAECLLVAREACQPYCRKLHLSMTSSWLSLERRDEAMDNLLATRGLADLSTPTGSGLGPDPQIFVSGNRLQAGTETRRPFGVDPGRLLHFPDCRFDFGRSPPVLASFEQVNDGTNLAKPLSRHRTRHTSVLWDASEIAAHGKRR